MKRRKFFGLVSCALATISFGKFGFPSSENGKLLNPVYVWRNGIWSRVRLSEIRKGDKFKMYQDADSKKCWLCTANNDPYYVSQEGCWGIVGCDQKECCDA